MCGGCGHCGIHSGFGDRGPKQRFQVLFVSSSK
jgi:hypothetical protein